MKPPWVGVIRLTSVGGAVNENDPIGVSRSYSASSRRLVADVSDKRVRWEYWLNIKAWCETRPDVRYGTSDALAARILSRSLAEPD